MSKYRVLTEQEEEILRRNGIDTEHVVVELRTEVSIWLLNHKTRDTIVVRQGDKKWDTY